MAASTAGPGLAHSTATADALAWRGEPWVIALLAVTLGAYAVGLARLWSRARTGAGLSYGRVGAFACGWAVVAVALCSPLDALAAQLFSAHMVQHELLMVTAAPLLVLGRPLATWMWSLPRSARSVVAAWTRRASIRRPWGALTDPFAAFLIHAAALWLWHVPVLFDAALAHESVHVLQHVSFLFSALLFWWPVIGRGEARQSGGVAVLYLFATMMHTGALGALLTLSTVPWYRVQPDEAIAWRVSPLDDQQLGGLIMWIPAGTVYVVAALVVMARWLGGAGGRGFEGALRPADPQR